MEKPNDVGVVGAKGMEAAASEKENTCKTEETVTVGSKSAVQIGGEAGGTDEAPLVVPRRYWTAAMVKTVPL